MTIETQILIIIAVFIYMVMAVGVCTMWRATPSGEAPNAAFLFWPIILIIVAAKGND